MLYIESMKNNFLLLLPLVLCLSAVSCSKPVQQNDTSVYTLKLDSLADQFPSLQITRCIPLETNDESLIANITKLIYQDKVFYIWDRTGKKVLLFDDKGLFLKSIHKVGQGPGEYTEPYDMDVDSEGNVYLSDWGSQSIIKYKLGNEADYETIKIGKYFLDFAIADDIIYIGNMYDEGVVSTDLAAWDISQGKLTVLRANDIPEGQSIPYSSNHYFFRSNQNLFFYERFKPEVLCLKEGGAFPFLSFISSKMPNGDDIKQWAAASPIERFQKMTGYIMDVSACYETERYLFTSYRTIPLLYGLIDKRTGSIYCTNESANSIPGAGACAVCDDNFVSNIAPTRENVQRLMDAVTDSTICDGIGSLSEEANPILVLFNFESTEQ